MSMRAHDLGSSAGGRVDYGEKKSGFVRDRNRRVYPYPGNHIARREGGAQGQGMWHTLELLR